MTKKENRVNYLSRPPRTPLEKLTSRKDGELGFSLGLAANQAMGFSAAELISPMNKQQTAQTFTRSFDEKNSIDSGFHRIFFRFSVATVSCYFNCFPESSAVVPTQTPQQLLHCHHQHDGRFLQFAICQAVIHRVDDAAFIFFFSSPSFL